MIPERIDNPGHMLARSMMMLRRGITRRFRGAGCTVTIEHWGLLNMLIHHEGINQTQLAEILFKDKPNLTRIVDLLERDHLVQRDKDPDDRRSYQLTVSDRGRQVVEELRPLVEGFVAEVFKDVNPEDYEVFMQTLINIVTRMEELESSTDCQNEIPGKG
jgi:DNA-binding MarR family transcriptional regulator